MNTARRAVQLAYSRDMTVTRLAELSGINYQTIMAANRRQTQLSVETIERICTALEISLVDFFNCDEGRVPLKKGM
jgi:DNA-binding Xre family transcriptional regulator